MKYREFRRHVRAAVLAQALSGATVPVAQGLPHEMGLRIDGNDEYEIRVFVVYRGGFNVCEVYVTFDSKRLYGLLQGFGTTWAVAMRKAIKKDWIFRDHSWVRWR